MTSVCHNPSCEKVGNFRCSRCLSVYFCGRQCQEVMHTFHKSVCALKISDFPLPEKKELSSSKMRQLQLFRILNAFDRTERVVPPEKDYRGTELALQQLSKGGRKEINRSKKTAKSYLMAVDVVVESKHTCPARRCVSAKLKESKVEAKPGQDIWQLQSENNTPLSILLRLTLQKSSFLACVSILSVMENLRAFGGFQPMHAEELIEQFFIVKGYIKTTQPRIEDFSYVEQAMQSGEAKDATADEHYAILFVPNGKLSSALTVDLEAANLADKQAMEFDAEMILERQKWTNYLKISAVPENLQRSEKCTNSLKALKDRAIFLAPSATEYDIRLHRHRLSKGIPEWFYIKQILSEADVESLGFSQSFSEAANLKAHQVLTEIVGADEAVRLIDEVTRVSEQQQQATNSKK